MWHYWASALFLLPYCPETGLASKGTYLGGLQQSFADAIGLRHKEDTRTLAIVLGTIACLAWRYLTFTTEALWTWEFWFWLVFTSNFSFFCATIVHNSIHVPLFRSDRKSQWKNSIFQCVLTSSYGFPVSTLIPGHNLSHHAYTQTDLDVTNTNQLQWRYNLINLLLFFPTCFKQIMKQDTQYMAIQRELGKPLYYQARREVCWLLFHQLLLLWFKPSAYFWTVLIPGLYGKFCIISINLLQHDGCPAPEEDKFNFSRNFVGTTINYFTCNNGYHTVHHWRPGLHWTELPEAHEKDVVPYCNPAVNKTNILWYVFTAFILGQRVDYQDKPFFPKEMPKIKSWVTKEAVMKSKTYSDASEM